VSIHFFRSLSALGPLLLSLKAQPLPLQSITFRLQVKMSFYMSPSLKRNLDRLHHYGIIRNEQYDCDSCKRPGYLRHWCPHCNCGFLLDTETLPEKLCLKPDHLAIDCPHMSRETYLAQLETAGKMNFRRRDIPWTDPNEEPIESNYTTNNIGPELLRKGRVVAPGYSRGQFERLGMKYLPQGPTQQVCFSL
jgi:hypothetical protein